jgi:hypothetical protein
MTDELCGDDLAPLPVDGDLERFRADLADWIAVGIDDLHVDGDEIDGASEHALSGGVDQFRRQHDANNPSDTRSAARALRSILSWGTPRQSTAQPGGATRRSDL